MRDRRLIWLLAVAGIDFSIQQTITPALPVIQVRLHASPTAVTWLVTSFLLSAAAVLPVVGPLGDRFGRRRMLLMSLAAYGCGSVVCALSHGIGLLIAGRVIEGLGGGSAFLTIAIAKDHLPEAAMPRVIGLLIGTASVGAVAGLLATGLLVDHVSVASVFWLLVAVSIVLFVAIWRNVPESPIFTDAPIDLVGAALLPAAVATLMLAISQGNDWGWGSPRVLGLLAGSVVLALGFVARQRTARTPLVSLSLLARRPILTANLAGIVIGLGYFGAYTVTALIAGYPKSTGYGLGLGSTDIALLQLVPAILSLVGGLTSARMIRLIGARRQAIVAGLFATIGYVLLACLRDTAAVLAIGLAPIGLAVGLGAGAVLTLAMNSASQSEAAVTASTNTVARTIGQALGPQILVAVLISEPTLASGLPSERGFNHAFVLGIVLAVGSVLVSWIVPRPADDPFLAGSAARASRISVSEAHQ
jgi:MFS family permease